MDRMTREDRIASLKKAAGKKRLGPVYWIRIFFTLFLFLLLSWYIKQGKNNPFSSRLRVYVAGSQDSWYIHCFKTEKKLEGDNLLFVAPKTFNTNQTAPSLQYPKTTTLITRAKNSIPYDRFAAPPTNWMILNKPLPEDSLISLPAAWPQPVYLNTVAGIKGVALHYIQPFSEPSEDVYLNYHTIKIAVINSRPSMPEALNASPCKEKFDIVVINTVAPVLKIREVLRPQFIIVLPSAHSTETIKSIPNMLKPEAGGFSYEIYKDSRKALHIKQIRNYK